MHASIALLPGDGVGPEVIDEARKVLEAVGSRFRHDFELSIHPMGGAAIDAGESGLPASTLAACRGADAVLLGAVGGPQWEGPASAERPEAGLLELRRQLGLYANIRPIKSHPASAASSPLRAEVVAGVDILFVRELTGGIYFGGSGRKNDVAWSTMEYSVGEVERIVRAAGRVARERRGRLTSVDKANVLEVSRLWRAVAERVVSEEFPEIDYEVQLVDAMAMHILRRPRDFDVVVTSNLFGDILTDEASMLSGSIGLLPSASIGDTGPGVFEPVHGSAPGIAGTGVANPLGAILAAALAMRHSLRLTEEAEAVEGAVDAVLEAGHLTPDMGGAATTSEIGEAVVDRLLAFSR